MSNSPSHASPGFLAELPQLEPAPGCVRQRTWSRRSTPFCGRLNSDSWPQNRLHESADSERELHQLWPISRCRPLHPSCPNLLFNGARVVLHVADTAPAPGCGPALPVDVCGGGTMLRDRASRLARKCSCPRYGEAQSRLLISPFPLQACWADGAGDGAGAGKSCSPRSEEMHSR